MSNKPKQAKTPPKLPPARRVAAQLKRHPLRYGLRLVVLTGFVWLIIQQLLLRGSVSPILLVGAVVYTALLIFRLLQTEPGDEVHQWALEENEHITMMSLKGKTPEELQQLLQYHLKYGNIQEADRISQKLLTMVDEGSAEETVTTNQAAPEPPASGEQQGLPDWMKS